MRVDTANTVQALTEAMAAPAAARETLQVASLKKALDNQKQEAAEMLKLLEPKGRVLDILV